MLYDILNFIFSILNFIFSALEKLNNLPSIVQGMGIALLTILVPLAIATLIDIYQKRKDQKIEFAELDLHVILDYVFKIKYLLFYVALIFLPMFLWEISSGIPRFIGIILSVAGIYLMTKIILDVYRWIKGNTFQFRFSYLEKKLKHDDLEIVWCSVWQTKNINTQNERKFFEKFSSTIDQLLKNHEKNFKTISKLLNDFSNFINNRSIIFLTESWFSVELEAFPKILEWHFQIWKKWSWNNPKEWLNYDEVLRTLDSIIKIIQERTLKERGSFSFSEHLKKHIGKYQKEVDKKKYYYAEYFLTNVFCPVFFENITDSPERYNTWERYFPREWKATKNNLKENIIPNIILREFLQWAQNRILKQEEKFDRKLENVSGNLFPEVDLIIWAKILIFVLSLHGESRVKSMIERPWNFGLIGKIRMYYSGEIKEEFLVQSERKTEVGSTFELAHFLFPQEFSKENLEKYIKELKWLTGQYQKESKEENKRLRLLNVFAEMLEYLNRQK